MSHIAIAPLEGEETDFLTLRGREITRDEFRNYDYSLTKNEWPVLVVYYPVYGEDPETFEQTLFLGYIGDKMYMFYRDDTLVNSDFSWEDENPKRYFLCQQEDLIRYCESGDTELRIRRLESYRFKTINP